MFVVRPRGIRGTPRRVAKDLGTETRFYPNPKFPNKRYDFHTDFFMAPVSPVHVDNAPPEYVTTIQFAGKNKYGQRKELEARNVPTPACASTPNGATALTGEQFVVRPLRHSGGDGYRVVSDRLHFTAGAEYISELYPKRREYRVIFVFGKPLIVLRKKPHEGVTVDQPWGHTNSVFQTINDVPGCKLSGTDCFDRLSALDIIKGSHIIAADILYNQERQDKWVCLELNFCPALTIDDNRAKVVDAIKGRL